MAHDPKQHGGHDHDHHHDHGHDHHHHSHDGDHHHWDSPAYFDTWVARDASRQGERKSILDRLVSAVPFTCEAEFTVLDVGAGSGVVSAALLDKFPKASITLQDYSPHMLAHAR